MMKMATGERFPLRQGAGTGLDWFSVAMEASGGGTLIYCAPRSFQGIWVYMGGRSMSVDLRAVHEAGGAPPTLVVSSGLSWSISNTPWASSGTKIISVKFQVNWTPFGFPFLRYSKTRKKHKLALGSRLIGQSQNHIKQHINAYKTSQMDNIIAWNNQKLWIHWRRIRH